MSLQGHYQNAYVTHDIERAVELAGSSFGTREFTVLDVNLTLQTPAGDKPAQLRVGLAWLGGLQIELIQPVSGYVDPYAEALPVDRNDVVPRLHHVAVRRDDLAAMRREVAELRLPLAFESGAPGLTCVFLDGRQRVGHHLEFVFATPAGWDMVGWPKGLTVR